MITSTSQVRKAAREGVTSCRAEHLSLSRTLPPPPPFLSRQLLKTSVQPASLLQLCIVFHADGSEKKAEVAILISDKIDFKIKTVTRDKGHHIMIKGSIPEEDIMTVNKYAPNRGAPEYIRQQKDLGGRENLESWPKYSVNVQPQSARKTTPSLLFSLVDVSNLRVLNNDC